MSLRALLPRGRAPRTLAAGLALALAPLAARASSVYPEALQDQLQVQAERPLPCTLCHETNSGGTGSVTRPFGLALQARGLRGDSRTDLLSAAVERARVDAVDSDGDGTPDVDELVALRNPNRRGSGGSDPLFGGQGAAEEPSYGCAAAAAPGAAPVALLALLALGVRRRRTARPGRAGPVPRGALSAHVVPK